MSIKSNPPLPWNNITYNLLHPWNITYNLNILHNKKWIPSRITKNKQDHLQESTPLNITSSMNPDPSVDKIHKRSSHTSPLPLKKTTYTSIINNNRQLYLRPFQSNNILSHKLIADLLKEKQSTLTTDTMPQGQSKDKARWWLMQNAKE